MPDVTTDDRGVPVVLCLLCGQFVRVVNGDRHRYAEHNEPATGARCGNSGEPVNAEGKS